MAHYRSEYRTAAAAAITGSAEFAGVEYLKVWAERLDPESLPVFSVVTPQERTQRVSHGGAERGTLLQVVIKRAGGLELADTLDLDSEAVEALVTAAIETQHIECALEETTVVVNGEGAGRVGTLVMGFRVTSWRPVAEVSP